MFKNFLDLTACNINEYEIKNGTVPCWKCKLLIPWEEKPVGIKILNIFILNLLIHIKGPQEIKCDVMSASNNYHSISDTAKIGKKKLDVH